MWRFKDLLADCFGGGFLVEATIFLFTFSFTLFSGFYWILFFCLSCFLLVQLIFCWRV